MHKHLFVINPAAGKKDRSELVSSAILRLEIAEPYDIRITEYPKHATEIVREALSNLEKGEFLRIYSCGGDGTLNEVVDGVYKYQGPEKNCAVGVIPIGSGNDFVRYFSDIPRERFRSLADMIKGEVLDCDLISITDENNEVESISINIASIGFDAMVGKRVSKFKRIPLVSGSMAYNMSVMRSFISRLRYPFTLFVDGEELTDFEKGYLFAVFANGVFYGGGFKASPYSDISDGVMDLIRIKPISRFIFATLASYYKKGEHLEKMEKYATHMQCKKVEIFADNPIDINIDGEIIPMTNPTVRVLPAEINIILPEKEKEEPGEIKEVAVE